MNAALLSSKNMNWCTPQDFFERLDEEFHFVLDAAATEKSAKCAKFFTPETDGLAQSWDCGGGGILQPTLRTTDRQVGSEGFQGKRGRVSYCFTYSGADGYHLFPRLHIRESGNPLHPRAVALHGRQRKRRRPGAVPVNGGYL